MKAQKKYHYLRLEAGKDVEYPVDENGHPVEGERKWWIWSDSAQRRTVTLFNNRISHNLSLPHQYPFFVSQSPLFYEDEYNTFLVVPNEQYTRHVRQQGGQTKATQNTDIKRCRVNALHPVIRAAIPVYASDINLNENKKNEKENTEIK